MAKWEFSNKQSPNYHSSDWIKLIKQPNGNSETKQTSPNLTNGSSATVLSLDCYLDVQTQTQTQTEPVAYRIHQHKEKF